MTELYQKPGEIIAMMVEMLPFPTVLTHATECDDPGKLVEWLRLMVDSGQTKEGSEAQTQLIAMQLGLDLYDNYQEVRYSGE
jgi:hypothetical protein